MRSTLTADFKSNKKFHATLPNLDIIIIDEHAITNNWYAMYKFIEYINK